jgi:hypothetical protein
MNYIPNPILNTSFIVEVNYAIVGNYIHITLLQSIKDGISSNTIQLEIPKMVLESPDENKINELIERFNGNIIVAFRDRFVTLKKLKDLLIGVINSFIQDLEKFQNSQVETIRSSQDVSESQFAVRLT